MEFAGFLRYLAFFERFCLRSVVKFRPYFLGTQDVLEGDGMIVLVWPKPSTEMCLTCMQVECV